MITNRESKIQTPEDQEKFIVPLNRDTELITYDMRFIIDAPILTEPRVWMITKPWRIIPNGLARMTCAQTQFNPLKDLIEKDEKGNVVGMWADGKSDTIVDYTLPSETIHSEITYSGSRPEIRVGGSYKKFTVNFFDGDIPVDFREGNWMFTVDDEDVSYLLVPIESDDVAENQIKVKFVGDKDYINKTLLVSYITNNGIESSLKIEIKAL